MAKPITIDYVKVDRPYSPSKKPRTQILK